MLTIVAATWFYAAVAIWLLYNDRITAHIIIVSSIFSSLFIQSVILDAVSMVTIKVIANTSYYSICKKTFKVEMLYDYTWRLSWAFYYILSNSVCFVHKTFTDTIIYGKLKTLINPGHFDRNNVLTKGIYWVMVIVASHMLM